MDESPDVAYYVLAEPALSAPEVEDWNIWQEISHLRTENIRWRECVTSILREVDRYRTSSEALREAVTTDVTRLGAAIADLRRTHSSRPKTSIKLPAR